MSLQLPAILSPPTPCIPSPALTVSPLERSPKLPCPLRVGVRFWASLTLRKLANASGRIVFNIALFMDWQFISGCLPPRLSTTQFPSTTDSQCSVRWGLPPHCWCALSGARRVALPRDPRGTARRPRKLIVHSHVLVRVFTSYGHATPVARERNPTTRHARHADTPTRRHADTPTRRYADTPTRRHADTFPLT